VPIGLNPLRPSRRWLWQWKIQHPVRLADPATGAHGQDAVALARADVLHGDLDAQDTGHERDLQVVHDHRVEPQRLLVVAVASTVASPVIAAGSALLITATGQAYRGAPGPILRSDAGTGGRQFSERFCLQAQNRPVFEVR